MNLERQKKNNIDNYLPEVTIRNPSIPLDRTEGVTLATPRCPRFFPSRFWGAPHTRYELTLTIRAVNREKQIPTKNLKLSAMSFDDFWYKLSFQICLVEQKDIFCFQTSMMSSILHVRIRNKNVKSHQMNRWIDRVRGSP